MPIEFGLWDVWMLGLKDVRTEGYWEVGMLGLKDTGTGDVGYYLERILYSVPAIIFRLPWITVSKYPFISSSLNPKVPRSQSP
jgi:hypothetical protein